MASPASSDNSISDEAGRLAALHSLALLDTEPEGEFDALVALAAEMLGCPTALLSLVDRDRLWVKASTGSNLREIPRDVAMCDHTIRQANQMIVHDLAMDPRFSDSPLVQEQGVRFYAGAPIHVIDAMGHRQPVGAICVLDSIPRLLPPTAHSVLSHIATLAEALLHARRITWQAIELATKSEALSAELARKDSIFRQAERMAMVGSWRFSTHDERLEWSDGVYRIYGVPTGQPLTLASALAQYPPSARARVSGMVMATIETGQPFDTEEDFINVAGDMRRIRTIGEREALEDGTVAVVGVFQDVTDRHRLENTLRRSADTDAVTGIPNRSAFDRALDDAIARATDAGTPMVLFMIDLDGFKAINDTLGHLAGDDVLRKVGRILRADWLNGNFTARVGGDEFAVIVEDPTLSRDAELLALRLEEALRFPVPGGSGPMTSAGTVGFAHFTPDCRTVRDLVHAADTVLYAAKRARVGERRLAERRRIPD